MAFTRITPGFDKTNRSSFAYWFAHLCAFNMTALNLHCWKPKYLLHDFEKPWLRLFLSYDKVQKIHRRNNNHHLTYKNPEKINWQTLVLDWECSRYTKQNAPRSAKKTYEDFIKKTDKYSPELIQLMKDNIPPVLEKLKLNI